MHNLVVADEPKQPRRIMLWLFWFVDQLDVALAAYFGGCKMIAFTVFTS